MYNTRETRNQSLLISSFNLVVCRHFEFLEFVHHFIDTKLVEEMEIKPRAQSFVLHDPLLCSDFCSDLCSSPQILANPLIYLGIDIVSFMETDP